MDKPPTKAKRSAKQEDAPDELDADLRRVLLRAAETYREYFDESPSRPAHQLSVILERMGRNPRLIEATYRFMHRKDSPTWNPGVARITKIGGVAIDAKRARVWEGPWMVEVTRWAIEEFDADPLDVAAAVVAHLPPMLRADCADATKDPDQVGLDIADLLADDGTGKTKQGWRDPEAVLRAILGELRHPRPDNVTR
jgi:hypothetical protein